MTAWLVALCLLVATEAFRYIPNNTLAAITIYGLSGLFDGQHAFYLWKVCTAPWRLVWCLLLAQRVCAGGHAKGR